jgi:hypothetical protein
MNTFIQGRQILDPILIANECLDNKLRFGESAVIYKIDLENANDHVNWDFLMRGWGEVVLLDNSLYFLGVVFGFGE